MKIIVVGATGIIGAKVVEALSTRHEVVGVARGIERKLNLQEPATMRALFEQVREVDAVVFCAGSAIFKPFTELIDADYELGLRSKLMGQVSLARIAKVPVVDVMEPPGQRPTAHPFPWSMRGSKVLCVRPRWNCREDYASMP